MTVAVVGNPNVGKTTLFNALTGLTQVTGNYPGVTVERKAGRVSLERGSALLIDLPGTYSMAARSPDEMIVADVLLGLMRGERPVDAVLVVVDATNLERNLYFVSQLLELGKPLVVALNMMDVAERRGITIDSEKLARQMGVPVVPVCAHKRVGVGALKRVLLDAALDGIGPTPSHPEYPQAFAEAVDRLTAELNSHMAALGRSVPRIEALRTLVDRGGYAEQRLLSKLDGAFMGRLAAERERVSEGSSLALIEVRSRYAWIRRVVAGTVTKPESPPRTTSDTLDDILTHRVWGTAIFAVVMVTVFQSMFNWAAPLMDLINGGFTSLGAWLRDVMPEGVLQSMVADGIISGVGSVVMFIPQIMILTFWVALLEDCGYMARAAFLMDKLLSYCGLSGQSFIPLLSSFACAVPGVMAARTIGNRRDRFTTIMVAPLMSCSARLPIYSIVIAAFIPNAPVLYGILGLRGITLFVMYGLGVVLAIPMAWLLKRSLLRGETPPFLLELPGYKWPQLGTVARKVWGQGREFMKRAGTVIVAVTVIVWALAYFPRAQTITDAYQARRDAVAQAMPAGPRRDLALDNLGKEESGAHLRNSFMGRAGHLVEPVVKPLGWDWRIGVAAIASFPAREIVVATLGTIFNLGSDVEESSEGLLGALAGATWPNGNKLFTIPVALSIMVFFGLCCQCVATLVTIRRETGGWRWPAFTFGYMTVLAYTGATAVYQITTCLGWGAY
jgi:ferrous iron transport protein B